MQCMEVWGGNALVDSSVVMAGLDAWVYSRPFGGSDGGGDVYYVSSCATGRITRLLVADVSGHGAAVCDVAGQLRLLMRRYVNHLDQLQFVRAMNGQFGALAKAGCFATAIVATFFAPTNYLTLCNAGHPPPLLYRARTRQWSFLEQKESPSLEPSNVPFGILDFGAYEQFGVKLGVGDLVLCYTDSLIECRDQSGELLGQPGLLRVVQRVDSTDGATFIGRLVQALGEEADIAGDDLTMLLFRPNGLSPGVPFSERLRGGMKMIRAIPQAFRPGGEPFPWPDLRIANVGGALFSRLNRFWSGPAERVD